MACQPHVGSLDAWLPSSPTAPTSHARHDSPFARAAQAAHSRSETEPVQIPRMPQLQRPTRLLEPIQHDALAANGKHQQPAATESASRDERRCVSTMLRGDQPHKSCRELDCTVHGGRHAFAAGPPWSSSDSQLSSQTIMGCDKPARNLAPCNSLPQLGAQAPITLSSLCTALSSRAVHVSLASTHSRHEINPSASDAADTAAANAAFTRSLIRTIELSPKARHSLQQAMDAGCKGFTHLTSPPAPASLLPPLGSRSGGSCPTAATVAALATHTARAEAVPPAATRLPAPPLSTKRGLYEGSVRAGSPRNTWRYCAGQPRGPACTAE